MQILEQVVDLIRNPGAIISAGGYPILALIVFLETGALIFFLPGDSLLVMAGLYAAKGDLNLLALNALLIPMAIFGDACSYTLGARVGRKLFYKEGSFLKPRHLQAAEEFYARHGGIAIILARFMPLVRTFVPVVAGMVKMDYRRFASYNVFGGIGWVGSMTCAGYFLGKQFPSLGEHIEKVILVIVLISVLPIATQAIWPKSPKTP